MEEETTDYRFENVIKEEAGVSLVCVTSRRDGLSEIFYKIGGDDSFRHTGYPDYESAIHVYENVVEAAKRPKCGLCKENKVNEIDSDSWHMRWNTSIQVGIDMKFLEYDDDDDFPLGVCTACKESIEKVIKTNVMTRIALAGQRASGGLND